MIDPNSVAFGRRPSLDERDKNYPMATLLRAAPRGVPEGLTQPFPGDYIWRHTPPALDQGPIGACVGYSWKQLLLQYPYTRQDGPDALTIYLEAQKIDEWSGENYEGTSVRAGVKYLRGLGLIDAYYWASSVAEIVEHIKTLGPVVMGTNWYQGMSDLVQGSIARIRGPVVGGHAWLIYGYSTSYQYFCALNSWGPGFGAGGTFWISEIDLARLLREDGEACAASETPLS